MDRLKLSENENATSNKKSKLDDSEKSKESQEPRNNSVESVDISSSNKNDVKIVKNSSVEAEYDALNNLEKEFGNGTRSKISSDKFLLDETNTQVGNSGEENMTKTGNLSSCNVTDDKFTNEENEVDQNKDALSPVDEEYRAKSRQGDEQKSTMTGDEGSDTEEQPTIFVHVNSKGDEEEKTLSSDMDIQEQGDESMEVTSITEEDPIGITQESSEKDDLMEIESPEKVVEICAETITSDKSMDEELCIIPDTEREISQEEKDAARAAAAAGPNQMEKRAREENKTLDKGSIRVLPASKVQALANTMLSMSQSPETPETSDDLKLIEISEDQATEETCHQCCMTRKCSFKMQLPEKMASFCSDSCVSSFRNSNKTQLDILQHNSSSKSQSKRSSIVDSKVFVRKCGECFAKIISGDDKVLSWETMEFCNEDCLAKYQNKIGSNCANCKKEVILSSLGRYCVRFGHDIRQFCTSICLEEFKKGLKVCSYCQKDISAGSEGFLAPVGDKGQFKDFCTQLCMEKYDLMSNKNNSKEAEPACEKGICSVCNDEKDIMVFFDQKTKKQKFCSDPCFVAFKFVNNTEPVQCDMCKHYFETDNNIEFSIFYDNVVRNFCCKTCQNIYIIANRKIVPCNWCKVKKYNFDMIKKASSQHILMMCSLNCLSLFQVSINAVSSKKMKCDHCNKLSLAQYHLTMSDATIRNFCTHHCVMSFQNQFAKLPITLNSGDKSIQTNSKSAVVPAGGPKRYQTRVTRSVMNDNSQTDLQLPVITSVQSLANSTNGPSNCTRSTNSKINNQQPLPARPPSPKVQVKQQIIVKSPPLPSMKNAATWCKPILHTKGVSCRPHPCNKETQTEEIKEKTILVPVPVPIYVPSPMHMFNAPMPIPVPFPLPIPVPIFVPTTRNSAAGIMKEIKKIQVKIPTDPFEAELLMMAEMVAGEKKVDNTDSESEEDDNAGSAADGSFSPEAVDTSNTFGDDMLQMALKMATELDEPAVDLEGALTANTITASQSQDNAGNEESVDDPQPMHSHHPLMERQNVRGRKRTNRTPRNTTQAKRGRRMANQVEIPLLAPPQPPPPPEPIEKPDAHMCLKYTFGVNAWKQWVTTKNAELEKSSRRMKLFKNEILQLTADELNYSLCLFVKEVRKPNGAEYAPDTIYYLCLGIQQYLFENGRIDNIFTDAYYEKFTDCLDEVARRFSILYNDSHYIVTRVEEEHLWESKQLGAHSPHVLLSTLMFFNTKHFNLTTVDEHMQLSFSHIMKHWKRNPNQPGAAKVAGSRNVLLRFYPPQTTLDNNSRKKKVYEQQENEENPLRCPVKLYEFYLSKCPESVKTRNDVFYLLPERSCVPDSPVWYSTMALGREALEKMLHRVKMVKEINVALLTS